MFAYLDRQLANVYRRLPISWQGKIEQMYIDLLSFGIGELHDPPMTLEDLKTTQQLSVIVPVHNAPDDTGRCLRSLELFAGEAEVILVDDGSTDPRASEVVRDIAVRNDWKMFRNEKSSFHSGACMSGAEHVTRPIMCLLNSDTVVTQHSWSLCVQALLDHPSLKAVGPRTSDGYTTQNDTRARRCRYVWSDQQIFWYAQRLYQRYSMRPPRTINRFVTGAALFLRREDWTRVGGFNGCRQHIGNDVDLCLKLTAIDGWIGVCDGAYVHHLGGRSALAT